MINKQALYQTGTINSLLEAVYEGDTTIAELKDHGDFGLGALDNIDGELIVCDGQCYRANEQGQLNILPDDYKTPFAVVNKFEPQLKFEIAIADFAKLEHVILPHLPSQNLIYAIRVTAKFRQISLRSEECTKRPYRRLVDILPTLQTTFEYTDIQGVLVGVWFPNYLAQVNVPGFHFHFVDDKREVGGHVFGMKIMHGVVEIQILHRLDLALLQTPDFYQATLDGQNHEAVAKVEQVRS